MNSGDTKGHLRWRELELNSIAPSVGDYDGAGAPDAKDALTVVCFSIGAEEFAIPVSDAVEVIKPRPLVPVPNMPDYISGILCHRGEMLTVVDFRRRLGLSHADHDADARILIVSCWDIKAGSFVEKMGGVREVPKASVRDAGKGAEGRFAGFVKGVLESGGKEIYLLDTYGMVEPHTTYEQ